MVVDKLLFRFLICGSVPEIFAIKVESCQKSRKIFVQFFCPPKLLGAGLPKIVLSLSFRPRGTSTEKSFVRILPIVRKLLSLTRYILGQILNFHDYNFLGDPLPVPVCTSKAWSISSACKNFRAQHPLRAEI